MISSATVEYQGSCHCGAVQFRVKAAPIDRAMRCNCSICRRKNAIMSAVYYEPDDFELLCGSDALTVYRFPPHEVNHHFCRHCGVHPFHNAVNNPELGYRINLCCVDDIDPHALPIRVFDGRDSWTYLD